MAAKKRTTVKLGGIVLIVLCILLAGGMLMLQHVFNGKHTEEETPFLRGTLLINEIMPSNNSSYADENGNFDDWIELYNSSDKDVDISGYTVSMGLNDTGYQLPIGTVIPAKGYVVLWFCGGCGGEGIHLPYRISKKGDDSIFIRDTNGYLIDKVTIPKAEIGTVFYRTPEGVWNITSSITPGYENSEQGRVLYEASLVALSDSLVISEICVSNSLGLVSEDGKRHDWIEIVNTGKSSVDLRGYYLTDDAEDLRKWQFPDVVIGAGEYLVIYLSGKDGYYGEDLHADFRLSNSAGDILLSDLRCVLVAQASYDQPDDYCSIIQTDDGYVSTLYQTPGYPNTEAAYEKYLKSESSAVNGVIINEIMLLNDSLIPTDGGRYYDWVELYNASSSTVDLSEYWLSDNENNLYKSQLPSISLAPYEYCIVYLSGEAGASTTTTPHTSFSLRNGKEPLILSNDKGICDTAVFYPMPYGYSYGRNVGKSGFFYIAQPSPMSENPDGTRFIAAQPMADTAQGVYEGIETLSVNLYGEGVVRYTLDGSDPDETSPAFTDTLLLDRTTVVRAASFADNKITSPVLTLSYIINEGHDLTVMSLVTDPDNLWDEKIGIYATGLNASEEYPYTGANYYENWERAANITMFDDGNTAFSLDCGVKIFGQSSRVKDKKSLQLKCKEKYGDAYLRYEVFSDRPGITRYDTLVLRSGAQDYNRSTFRDELLTGLVAGGGLELLTQAYIPCVLYLNGEYWGIYFLREKIDEDYISQHLNVSPESVTLLRGNWQTIYGDNDEYIGFYSYAKKLDMTVAKNYRYVCSKIDIDSYIDYYIAQAYLGNRDVTNVKFYKSTESDGKWRWILFDLDYGFDYAYTEHYYTLYNLIKEEGTGYENKMNNELIRALLKNEEFLDRFLTRYGYWLNTSFVEENVISAIDDMVDMLASEQERNALRWNFKMSTYRWYVSTLKDFVQDGELNRRQILIEEARTLFNLTDEQVAKYFYPEASRPDSWEGTL